ncbi:MAG: hypothetical protein E7660_00995 [Ruminococcaceae bacterium]|nr:hypothetical protein [Oscillospiraceae bacterium]
MKKIRFCGEAAYFVSLTVLALAVSLIASTNFGLSMVVAPAYLLSMKLEFLTFGQSEYIVQGLLFILLCILMKKVKLAFFFSFISGLIYGVILDAWRLLPHLNPDVTVPGTLPLPLKITYFVLGMLLTGFSIALCFKSYLYPQVYDFFVMGISEKYKIPEGKLKLIFDLSCLTVSVAMSFILFGKITGIGFGTFIMAFLNGVIIGAFGKFFDKHFDFSPALKKFSKHFEID